MNKPEPAVRRRSVLGGIDRGFLLLIVGAVVLILLGLISIPLIVRRPPSLAAANTPEGVVQRFYQAAYQGDYQSAYGFLSSDTQHRLSQSDLHQQLSGELQNSQMGVSKTMVHDSTATVTITLTYVRPGGIFSSGEYSSSREVLLRREGDAWKIDSGPFFLEPKR